MSPEAYLAQVAAYGERSKKALDRIHQGVENRDIPKDVAYDSLRRYDVTSYAVERAVRACTDLTEVMALAEGLAVFAETEAGDLLSGPRGWERARRRPLEVVKPVHPQRPEGWQRQVSK